MGAINPRGNVPATPPPNQRGNVSAEGINQGGRKGVQPLASLYTNKYIPTNLKYPSNLDSDVRGHIIQFSINDTQASSYSEGNQSISVDDVKNKLQGIAGSNNNSGAKSHLTFQPTRNRIDTTIALYIPDNISESYESSYTDVSLLDAAKEISTLLSDVPYVGKAFSAVNDTISALQSDTGKLAASAFGVAINPQKQVIFDGIDFRKFQFSFTFSPKSLPESDTVNQIIKTFKYHAAPSIGSGVIGSFFFTPPSSFTIEYLYNGSTNTYINKIAECVLESVSVNYAPNGIWSAFDQTGAPTQVTLSLSFKEIELVDRKKINEGF
jgi:hypothetical protein